MKNLIVLLFCTVLVTSVQAKILRVNNTANMAVNYTTVAAAVAAATDGDTIHIEGSVTPYTGNVTVNKKLTIVGPGYFLGSTAETQYSKETARINFNFTFDTGSEGSILAGVAHHTGASGYVVNTNAYGTGNKVIIQTDNISVVSCKLFYVEINNAQPRSNIFIQRCFFNPGVVTAIGTGVVTNLTITNCFFRNDFGTAPAYLVINGAAGKQSNWRVSQCTFYNYFQIIAENTVFANNAFYGATAAGGTITSANNSTNTYTNNVMRYSVGGMANGVSLNTIPPISTAEDKWFSRAGSNTDIDIYYTSATATTACPLRDGTLPGDDVVSKGMYGGGAAYVPSGMFTIPSVYDIVMDAEVGDSFNMVIRARTH